MKTFRRRQTGARNGSDASSLLGRFWLPFCLLFGLAYFAGAQWYYAAHESASRQTRYEQQAIETVALHDRLSGYNPLPPDTDRDVPEPTPETHRALRLELVKEDGSLLKLRLVRSLDWIEAEEAQPGRTVFMDLPEFGAVGEATVLAMEPCPAVPPGSGNLVTGIFEHTSGSVIDLYLEGAAEPLGCTANHRFWSEDRKDYVEAGQLRPGERVWTRKLGSTAVVGSVPRPGTHRVWNLEVHGEHVYEVGDLGVLVHNSYDPKKVVNALSDFQSRKFYINGHNIILDKSGMKHILERHHPSYWSGTSKAAQTFFSKNTTVSQIEMTISEVLKQNSERIAQIGANGIGQVTGVVNGITYRLGLSRGRIGQFFPL